MWYQQWWVWVIIVLAVIGIGWIKLKVLKSLQTKRKKQDDD